MNRIETGINLYASVQAAAVLGFCMMQDIRMRMVSVKKLFLFLLASMMLCWRWDTGIEESLTGFAVGVVFILLSVLTGERIGMGDALLITCIGWSFGAAEQIQVLFLAFAGASVYGSYLLIRNKSRNTEFAFIPFLFSAYLIVLILNEINRTGLIC